jgi:putative transcriptional regulator
MHDEYMSESDPLAPAFLIAVPHLVDPNFRQSVVLLLERNEDGAMGVVINQESSLLLSVLCSDHDIEYGGDVSRRVRKGGPVQPEQGLVLYSDANADPEGRQVLDGLHVSASRGTLGRLCHQARARFHCFSGYAGWGPGQLEREIADGAWVIGVADPETVLDTPPEDVWNRCLQSMGIDPAMMVPGGGAEA